MCSGMRVWLEHAERYDEDPPPLKEAWKAALAGPRSSKGAGGTSGPRLNKIAEWD